MIQVCVSGVGENVKATRLVQQSAGSVPDEYKGLRMKRLVRRLQEEVEARSCSLLSIFHTEPSSTDYRRRVNRFARENSEYGPKAPEAIVRKAPTRESNAFIRGIYKLALRAFDGYSVDLQYGTEEFEETVNESHHRVDGMSEYAIVSVAIARRKINNNQHNPLNNISLPKIRSI